MPINEMSDNLGTAQPRSIIFVAYPQMGLLDLTGAQTVIWSANRTLEERGMQGYAFQTTSQEGSSIRKCKAH